jgi:hypothetical protein
MEKIGASGASDVEATLLSGNGQWVYVSPHSTSWVEFSFGIGGSELWLNGKLNIGINVYEDPDEYYGGSAGGWGGASGGSGG